MDNLGSSNLASLTRKFKCQTFQHRFLTGLNYWPNASSSSMSYQVRGYIYSGNNFNYGNVGVYDSSANIAGGTNNWTTYTLVCWANHLVNKISRTSWWPKCIMVGVIGSSPQYAMMSIQHIHIYWGGNSSFNNSSSAGVGVRVYASFYAGWYASMQNYSTIDVQMYGTQYYTYYTNHVSSSSSTVNLGASFSVSGDGLV